MVQPHSLKMSSWTAESAASLLSYIFYVHRAATERKVGVVALNMPWDSCGLQDLTGILKAASVSVKSR